MWYGAVLISLVKLVCLAMYHQLDESVLGTTVCFIRVVLELFGVALLILTATAVWERPHAIYALSLRDMARLNAIMVTVHARIPDLSCNLQVGGSDPS